MKKDEMEQTHTKAAASPADDQGREQLSAWLDGELPDAQARFLLRRLEHDPALRAHWGRLQVASSCLRNQPWTPMAGDLGTRVSAGIAAEAPASAIRRAGAWRWAVAASLAVLAVVLVPRMGSDAGPDLANVAQPRPVASLAAADLVASRSAAPVADAVASAPVSPGADSADVASPSLLAAVNDRGPVQIRQESPMPLASNSPADFPLANTGEKRWPRSELAVQGNDPALEAYLVRHNQMISNDGLSGFVPYVDVVASGAATSDPSDAPVQDSDRP
ncbi:MAG: RseA family anti-sigma factor [Pseudoxanthomonas sp.]